MFAGQRLYPGRTLGCNYGQMGKQWRLQEITARHEDGASSSPPALPATPRGTEHKASSLSGMGWYRWPRCFVIYQRQRKQRAEAERRARRAGQQAGGTRKRGGEVSKQRILYPCTDVDFHYLLRHFKPLSRGLAGMGKLQGVG